ncbi:copper ABC transporter permease [Virgibacillus profundi]|uniref:Copper ABC transporter permease n=1 Tax=Virgibacillus profundi TaxID=2024555 RepID=A0A2A2IGZ6_9BACI|nr:ABC transporter permease subunit [Virgibacillus profundi]PAV31039.1 copper ABC transporter permease [Virgibacillus profundi]PXY55225.1 copper ABC transporter permease [Virgibacillus profundi]
MKRSMFQSMLKLEIRVLLRSKWLLSLLVLFIGLAFLLYFYGIESAKSTAVPVVTDSGETGGVVFSVGEVDPAYFGLEAVEDTSAVYDEDGNLTQETMSNAYSRSIAMLINLSLWIVPIICLIIGTNSLVADKEEGRFSLYRTYQMSNGYYLISKYMSLCVTLMISLGVSYGIFGLFLYFTGALQDAMMFGVFLALNLLIIFVFSGLAILIGSYAVTRMQGLSLALFAWSFLVFVYEFIIYSIIDFVPYAQKLNILFVLILANPVESIRVWAINNLGANYIFGSQYLILDEWGASGTLNVYFFMSIILIIIISLILSVLVIKRRVA